MTQDLFRGWGQAGRGRAPDINSKNVWCAKKGGGGELSDCVVLFWVNFISEGSGGQGRTQAASS